MITNGWSVMTTTGTTKERHLALRVGRLPWVGPCSWPLRGGWGCYPDGAPLTGWALPTSLLALPYCTSASVRAGDG